MANAAEPLTDAASGTVVGRESTIGEMARAFGVTLRTLRFYEDRGLLRPRRVGNARFYGGVDRARLAMILKGKHLGFTLSEIADLIGADEGVGRSEFEERLRPAQIVDQLSHLERQRHEIDEAIALLKATRERMSHVNAMA
jgi:DNA-binding transcriptional MerR regulator